MACMLYVREGRSERWLGRFKNRPAAEDFFHHWKRSNGYREVTPIYVETGKKKGERKRG